MAVDHAVTEAIDSFRDAVGTAAAVLTPEQYIQFLHELTMEADSWARELEELEADEEDEDDG